MLAIRLQRTGRSGHAQFRIIVQDSRFSPKRGRVVAYLGNYNPHTKTVTVDSAQAAKYLENGAQPSDRVARLLKSEGIKLPDWVKLSDPKQRAVRNPEKRRSTAPAQPAAEEQSVETDTENAAEAAEQPAETSQEEPAAAAEEVSEPQSNETENTEEPPAK